MAASACFVPAPPAHAPATRAAAALLVTCWVASGFVLGVCLALGDARPAVRGAAGPPPTAVATTFREQGRATFYRPAGSRAQRPALRLRAARFEPRRDRSVHALRLASLRP